MKDDRHAPPTLGVIHNYLYEGTVHDYFFHTILRGIYAAACKNGCNLLLGFGAYKQTGYALDPSAWPFYSPDSSFVPISPQNIDGLIITDMDAYSGSDIFRLVKEGFPIVNLLQENIKLNVNCDDFGGMYRGIAHLVEHGHRSIAFIGAHRTTVEKDYMRRLTAYRKAVWDFKLDNNPNLIEYGELGRENSRLAMKRLLDSGVRFTAVAACDDNSAIGAMEAIREAGLRIPEDIAVIGFDDTYPAMVQDPSLTTLHQQKFETGYQAVELLLEKLSGAKPGNESKEIPVNLIIRESCGCKSNSMLQGICNYFEWNRYGTHTGVNDETSQEILSQLVDEVTAIVIRSVEYLSQDIIKAIYRRLIEGFKASVERGASECFDLALKGIIEEVTAGGDDICVLQPMIIGMRKKICIFINEEIDSTKQKLAQDMLDSAVLLIGEGAVRQHRRHIIEKNNIIEQLGILSARLMPAVDEKQIFQVLEECIPMFQIKQMDIAFFESEGKKPTEWSNLYRIIPPQWEKPYRFRTCEFPPSELFPKKEACRWALLPLLIDTEQIGYVVFDADNLWPCTSIMNELATAIKGVGLYRKAIEGRKLAEESNLLKSKFLSMVSHELRTPLHIISSLSEMLIRRQEQGKFSLPEEYGRDFKRIHASAKHLDTLISDVLDMTQSEAGRLKLAFDVVDIIEVITEVQNMVMGMVKNKGLSLEVEVFGQMPKVWGDRTRIRQIVLNLVTNAIKFTERGGICIRTQAKERNAIVSVSDTGMGIVPGEQRHIFEEFMKSGPTFYGEYAGLGLGLAIAKRLIEMHNGTIEVSSSGKEGCGSTFTFTLPLLKDLSDEAKHEYDLNECERKVVILSKSGEKGGPLENHLSGKGYAVDTIDMDAGMEWYSGILKTMPEAVIFNFRPEIETGWEVMRALKDDPRTRNIQILFYSLLHETEQGSIVELDYFTKPVSGNELLQELRSRKLYEKEKLILIVDDDPEILDIHERLLKAELPFCRVVTSGNGQAALEVLQKEAPDLVLLDLMMPVMDGYAVLEAMQRNRASREIPVIILTGQIITGEEMLRLNQGVAAVLKKGVFSMQETLEHIEEVLSKNKSSGSEKQRIVRKAMAYIHDHYKEQIGLTDICNYVHITKRHLTRCFREEIGITPIVYLNRYRIDLAKTLLKKVRKSVTGTAFEVGFLSASYFSRVFLKETGISPYQYKSSN